MTDSKKEAKPKQITSTKPAATKKLIMPIPTGLDWDKIKADFEEVYDPAKNIHLAGRQIARIVVKALAQLKKK